MFVQVFLMPHRGASPLMAWEEDRLPEIDERTWKESSQVLPKELLKNPWAKVDVFLVQQSEFVEEIYDAAVIENLLRHARMYTWNSDIYVVIDQSLDRRRGQRDIRVARENYLSTLKAHGVTDVLEARVQDEEVGKIPGKLFAAAARSLRRRDHLESLAAKGEWRCYLNEPPATVASFLGAFTETRLKPDDRNYVLVPLELKKLSRGSVSPEEFIEGVLREHPDGSFAVAHIDETSDAVDDGLKKLCDGGRCQFLKFRGLFELHYFLQSLAATYKRGVPVLEENEEIVRPHERVRFSGTPPPSVLITHSFAPDDDVEQCSEAACDAYEIMHRLPGNCRIVVHPAVNCEILPDIVEPLRHLTAWVHIGHGESVEGLRESGEAEVFKRPEQWLECFLADEEGGRSLALACFACCQSAGAARLFAAAGAGVAIGFASDVELNLCRAVAKEVVPAAVGAHGDRGQILKAFRRGRARLKGLSGGETKAAAFCSER
jgi:hypothetical protein